MSAPLTVSELTERIQQALAVGVGSVVVRGEVSKFTAHRSGHWYFSIQDGDAVLNCVMFRGNNRFVRVRPASGSGFVLAGEVEVYAPQGRYSLIVRRMEPVGAGDLQAKIEALKRRLQQEGLFDPSLKKPLPGLPRAIGVATSPTGAAFQDIRRVLAQRFPGIPIYLSPCRVQGDQAPGNRSSLATPCRPWQIRGHYCRSWRREPGGFGCIFRRDGGSSGRHLFHSGGECCGSRSRHFYL